MLSSAAKIANAKITGIVFGAAIVNPPSLNAAPGPEIPHAVSVVPAFSPGAPTQHSPKVCDHGQLAKGKELVASSREGRINPMLSRRPFNCQANPPKPSDTLAVQRVVPQDTRPMPPGWFRLAGNNELALS